MCHREDGSSGTKGYRDRIGRNSEGRSTLLLMLQTHKRAISEIKSGQQRVKKATEERDKLREKLKKAQARLAEEKERLRKSEAKLES